MLRPAHNVFARLPPAVRAWLAADRSEWTTHDAFRFAIATRVAETQYAHPWRQIKASDTLIDAIDACVARAVELVEIARARVGDARLIPCEPWRVAWEDDDFLGVYDGAIEVKDSRPHLVGPHMVVYVVTAPVLRHDCVLHVALGAALRSLHLHTAQRAFIVHANAASLFEIECRLTPHELIRAVVARRIG